MKARMNKLAVLFLAAAVTLAAGCTTSGSKEKGTPKSQRTEIEAGVDSTLSRLYEASSSARELSSRAEGVLVFPSVLSASFIVGGEVGDGALRVKGKTQGYYSIAAGSVGFQAGAQSKAIVLMFMTPEALNKFRSSSGWTAGVDATVAVAEIGATGAIDTNTMRQPVIGFVLSNAGIMAGVSLQGAKISPKEI